MINNYNLNLLIIYIPYYHSFINPTDFMFNYTIILFIHFIYLNLLFDYLINLSKFDIYQFIVCVLN